MQVGKTLVSFYGGACSIVGMNDAQEHTIALIISRSAEQWATAYCDNKCDVDAATAAVLIRALELATPDLLPHRRASLFCDIDAMLQAEREACAIAALNAPIKTATQPIREACANAIRARNEII